MEENEKGILRRLFGFLTAVVIGGAVGSILGLTLAPKKGKDMRKYLKEHSYGLFSKGHSFLKKDNKKVGLWKQLLIKMIRPKRNEDNDSL
ncbi:YtxH domain-containing protein [Candidatus Peregrinibacteria bacterium]|nr:YtxH domain-containing protein [Candidatus Peregrinibacteria bacterium]